MGLVPEVSVFGRAADFTLCSRLAQPDTRTTTILRDEQNACVFQGAADRGVVGGRHDGCVLGKLGAPDGRDTDRRVSRQVLGAPAQQRPCGADLGRRQRGGLGRGGEFGVDWHPYHMICY